MFASQILLVICVATTIGSIHAKIPYNEIGTINIFDNSTRDFEHRTIASTRLVQNFFERADVLLTISAGIAAMKFTPFVMEFGKIIPLIGNTLEDKSEWRSVFSKAISDETMRAVTESEVSWMEASLQTIQTKIRLLGDENSDDENRKIIATIIHTDLVRMINLFDSKSSLFRKYPLMGAPPLIQLASLVAIFYPLIKSINPLESANPEISCKMHDVLVDYRPRVVNARLRELINLYKMSSFKSRAKVMSLPYNSNGYNETNPGEIDCKKGCNNQKFPREICLEDKFSKNIFNVSITNGTSVCVEDYGRLVRHRVEELFPIDLLDKLCSDRKPKIPTGIYLDKRIGFGWFTINIQQVYMFGRMNGEPCGLDYSYGCNPSIKLFVNDEPMLETPNLTDIFTFDAKITFTTAKIRKNSRIKIEVWHVKQKFWDYDSLIQSVHGNIDSFLNEPLRQGDHVYRADNHIETVSFWRDEFE